jgi:hypothetical protein
MTSSRQDKVGQIMARLLHPLDLFESSAGLPNQCWIFIDCLRQRYHEHHLFPLCHSWIPLF